VDALVSVVVLGEQGDSRVAAIRVTAAETSKATYILLSPSAPSTTILQSSLTS